MSVLTPVRVCGGITLDPSRKGSSPMLLAPTFFPGAAALPSPGNFWLRPYLPFPLRRHLKPRKGCLISRPICKHEGRAGSTLRSFAQSIAWAVNVRFARFDPPGICNKARVLYCGRRVA